MDICLDYVVDRNGNPIDVVNNDTFILPVAVKMRLVKERGTALASNLEYMINLTKVDADHKVAEITDRDRTHVMTRVVDGEGIYKLNKKGEWIKAKDNSLKTRSSSFFIAQQQVNNIYTGFLMSLFPELGRIYVNTASLQVNHCIIPWWGYKYPAICSEFFEIVDGGRNKEHERYVNRWDLYDCPVSALDLTRLDVFFNKNNISMYDEPYDSDDINNFLDIFIDPRFSSLKKKLATWWYFMNKHTTFSAGVWREFRKFFTNAYPDSELLSDECIKKTLDNQIEL
jgi:hypothetical protein